MRIRNKTRWLGFLLALGAALALWAWAQPFRTLARVYVEPVSKRPYRVITRRSHDPRTPAPVLFVLHAYATTPEVVLRGYRLEALAVQLRGFILVVPRGKQDALGHYFWNASRACCGERPTPTDDLGYLQGVLTDVERHFAVDRRHILALGVSNGGFMAYRWACTPDAPLTAFVNVSGAGPGPDDPACAATKPISVLHVHGDADDIIRYQGGDRSEARYPSARASITPFLKLAHGPAAPRVDRTRMAWFGTLRQEEWRGEHARVALWTVEGAGHQLRAAQIGLPWLLSFLDGE